MNIFVFGLNYKTAPIEIREKFSIAVPDLSQASKDPMCEVAPAVMRFHFGEELKEYVILSTCNRTEIYGATSDVEVTYEKIAAFFAGISGMAVPDFESRIYRKTGREAVEHLFRVASGLDSMVLGETEILGQVKDMYLKAHANGWTGKTTNALFQKALQTAKKIRTQTDIGSGKMSIASIAVDLSKKIFFRLEGKVVLLIGSGQVAGQVCEALVSQGVKEFVIANRSRERAEALVESFGGRAVEYVHVDEEARLADIVIASAGAPKAFVDAARVEQWTKHRHRKSLFLIDLGVPRNIHESVNELGDVYLYNLDDLKEIADKNRQSRESAIFYGEQIITDSVNHFFKKVERTRSSV